MSDEEDQKARAKRLREEIDRLKSGGGSRKGKAESPRDFTERRRRELEEAEKKKGDSGKGT